MTNNDWLVYNGAEANGIGEEILPSIVDVQDEIAACSKEMVAAQFDGTTVAGDNVVYTFNQYGQLTMTVKGFDAKGSLKKGIELGIYQSRKYFEPLAEYTIGQGYEVIRGTMFPKGSKVKVDILLNKANIIGIYKAGTDLEHTIRWYNEMVYKQASYGLHKLHKIQDFRPEWREEDDVYKDEYPSFQRTDELEEIASFITSLRGRRLGAEEQQLLADIRDEIEMMGV